MSTAKFDTLSNLAGTQSVPVATVAQGSAKAWVNFNGTGTVAIRASFNVSSITDNGTGNYTVNFTTAMPEENYAWQVGGWNNGTGNGGWIAAGVGSGSYPSGVSATSLQIVCFSPTNFQDQEAVCVSIFR
jgi:hypothetical protein